MIYRKLCLVSNGKDSENFQGRMPLRIDDTVVETTELFYTTSDDVHRIGHLLSAM